MAVGTGIGVDLDALKNAIKAADKGLEDLISNSKKAKSSVIQTFLDISTQGVEPFLNKLGQQKEVFEALSKVSLKGASNELKSIVKETSNALDQTNKLITVYTELDKALAPIQEKRRATMESENDTKALQKWLELKDKEAQKNDEIERNKFNKSIENIGKQSAAYQKAEDERYQKWLELKDKEKQREQADTDAKWQRQKNTIYQQNAQIAAEELRQKKKNAEEERKIAELLSNERIEQVVKEARRRIENEKLIRSEQKKAHDQRQRELEELFREQERQAKAQAKADSDTRKLKYKAYTTSYAGAIYTSDHANTLAKEIKAVKNLEAAREKLKKTDADYHKKLGELNTRIKQHNQNIERATAGTKKLNGSLATVGRSIASAFSVQALRGYVNQMIKVRGEMELQQRSLQAILQNKDAANEIWQKTIDLAVRSPFRIKDLVTYTKQLAAYRVEADKLYETNKMLADVSAGLGVDMQRLILAFGQVKAANFLRGTELRQFTEAGIPMLDELAKHFNDMNNTALTSADVFEMISKRMVLFEDVEAVFERLTKAGGTFYRMQEIQAETLRGQISNLKDSIDIMLNDMGKANDGTMKFAVKSVKTLVDNYERLVPILKAVATALLLYKLNAFLAARQTGILSSMLLNAGVAMEKFMLTIAKNPWTVLATAIISAGAAMYRFYKQLKEVDKTYRDMLNQQSEITAKFFKAEDIDERKRALKDLIEYAEKEYSIKVSLDIKDMSDNDVKDAMNKLRQQMIEANAFGAEFQKEWIRTNQKSSTGQWWDVINPLIGQGMNKDIDQMGDSYENLNRILVNNLAPTIDYLSTKLTTLDEDQRNALESLKTGIGEWSNKDEDIADYFERIRQNYETLIKALADSDDVADKKISRQLKRYQRRYDEAEKEFQSFVDNIDDDVKKLSDENKTVFLNAAIDDAKAEKNWSKFEETQIRKWLEKKYTIELTPKIVEEDEELKAWQDSYNDLFEGKAGWRKIRTKGTSQTQVIEQLNAQYKATEELVNRIQLAGEDSILEGGAYEGENLEKLKKDLADIREQLDWFGAEDKKDKNKESASIKILQKRINLLKEVNKKYLELEKTFDAVTAKEKVMEAYSDTFKEAFEGTGVELDMYKIMTQVITDSKKVGEGMGSSLSEGMIAKLKELEKSGTYIRTANDAAEEFTKGWEQAILKAKDVEGLGKGYTIGYGEYGTYKDTGKKVGKDDIITQAEAAERFSRVVYPKYVEGLNKILDKHKELVLTQEQYNALLDLTYQGGYGTKKKKGPAELLIEYAKDEERAIAHITKIRESFAKVYGQQEAELRFGDAFVQKLKDAQNIYEKMALLLSTMNLTIDGEVQKGYRGMVNRTDARVELFSGSLDIANQLETVLVRIAGMDFTTTEGMVEALGKLKEIAEKEGPEAKNILSQAISGLEAEIGVRLKKDADQKLNDEVQAMFDRYELTLDLKKLNLPKGLAEDLFNTEFLDLKGLREAVKGREAEFIGTDQEKQYKEFLEKIDEMERKSIVERTKTYAEYLMRGMSERAKLKVEELRKLKELEESKEFTTDQKKQIRKQIQVDSQKKLDKAKWEEFTGMDSYIMMFEDLETLGTQSIKNLYENLDKLRLNLSHLDPSEVKEIVNQMEKLQEEMIKRNPFKAFRDARKDIKAIGESEETLVNRLFSKEKIEAEARQMIDSIATIENAFAEGTFDKLRDEEMNLFESFMPQFAEGKDLAAIKKGYQQILDDAKEGKEITADQLKNFADYRKSLQGISDYWGAINDQIQNITGNAINIMEVYGVDEATKSIAEGIGSMSTLILQAIQFGIQMEIVGYKSNMALGIIGWIAMGIQAIATVITAIANYKNAKIDAQLEEQAKSIEKQRDLYEQIEKKVESAYNVDQLRQYNNEMARSVDLEIQALEASIALEKSRKNADQGQIEDWQKEITEARERLVESTQSMMDELGAVFDLSDFTSGFVDAWWDAMDEGMSGLDALGEHFEDTMRDMVKKQALYRGAKEIMSQLQDAINASLEGDYSIDQSEWQTIIDAAKKANVNLDAFLQGWYDMFGSMSDGASGSLSALQKGIQGITEDTAQIIEAYLNSIRGYVSEQVTHTKNIYRILYDAVHSDAAAIRVRMV